MAARILIAEDSETDLQFIKVALQGSKHSFMYAKDGEEAEAVARQEKPDLIILDVIMPKKNGFQVCRDLKKDDYFKQIPIILLTSKSQESDKFWGIKQGADEYITKPFEPQTLISAIKKFLGTL
ncbi:MAG: two-component system response regulator [Thermoplasmata archaeon M9B2D]|nr:MAG: two-component system response regulator [Thermoplasmata archaeon M9B2D]PNX53063.1 MAG: two-component system response regulator [Thermoplasmata archaeon M9B2D]